MDFKKKEIIGMIHLAGPDAINKAMEEIRIYEEEGLSGIIVENYHGTIEEVNETLEMLSLHSTTMSVGVNILPNEYGEAFNLANKFNFIDFMQLDYISGKYKTSNPNKHIELDFEDFSNKWLENDKEIKIFGGVWPKYYQPVDDSDLRKDLMDAIGLFFDGVVVTGSGTGSETPLEKIKLFRETMDGIRGNKSVGKYKPLIVGAGLTPLNVREQLQYAQGGIVGSAFKPLGRTHQMIDRDLVKSFMDEVNKI